jgi:formate hydrogenlyase subunit 3/multisubunit Na+/H+ antiporter MnhD subunit
LAVYLTFGELNFDKVAENFALISSRHSGFLAMIFTLLILALVIKFFPFWLYFEKLKSSNLLANFLVMDSLFIKTNIGIFLLLKFVYFFFGNKLVFGSFDFSSVLIFLSILLIFYSAIKLYQQKHLKFIAAFFCLNNLGFIFACMALQKTESLQAMFFYILNFSLVNLLLFIFASFLKRYFASSSIGRIWLIRKHHFLLVLPLKILVFFIAAFPLTILFSANWYMAFSSFRLGFEAFLLIGLIISNFAYVSVAMKLISSFFAPKIDESLLETFDHIYVLDLHGNLKKKETGLSLIRKLLPAPSAL